MCSEASVIAAVRNSRPGGTMRHYALAESCAQGTDAPAAKITFPEWMWRRQLRHEVEESPQKLFPTRGWSWGWSWGWSLASPRALWLRGWGCWQRGNGGRRGDTRACTHGPEHQDACVPAARGAHFPPPRWKCRSLGTGVVFPCISAVGHRGCTSPFFISCTAQGSPLPPGAGRIVAVKGKK